MNKMTTKVVGGKSRTRLIIDHLVARRRFEQLKLLTTTDLSLINSAEPYRLSGIQLFKSYFLDSTLIFVITLIYIVTRGARFLYFIFTFGTLFFLVNYHIESYRSFKAIRSNLRILERDPITKRKFLATRLARNDWLEMDLKRSNFYQQPDRAAGTILDSPLRATTDSFRWVNKIIIFFWPYLSHLIHFELNRFFREQIESGLMAMNENGLNRLFYSVIQQLNSHILVIEKCRLGGRAPCINSVRVSEICKLASDQQLTSDGAPRVGQMKARILDKNLALDIELEYNGDMDVSVIYRYLCCCSSRIGLKDVYMKLKLRVVLGPILDEAPFIEQVSFSLLDLPEFGYKGIALAELAELRIIRGVINRQIKENILHPNSVSIGLREFLVSLLNGSRKADGAKKVSCKQPAAPTGSTPEAEVSCWTKSAAKLLIFGCFCSNLCLRCCRKIEPSTNNNRPDSSSNMDASRPD